MDQLRLRQYLTVLQFFFMACLIEKASFGEDYSERRNAANVLQGPIFDTFMAN